MTDITTDIDPRLFRHVMGRFPTGVTVITVWDGEDVRGMTANAFMSGSLEPPLLVVSVAKKAHMHRAIRASEGFGVNILAAPQQAISDHFAGRPSPDIDIAFETRFGIPLLSDACARMATKTVAEHDCGDHTIFIGRIVSMDADDRSPLVYHAGRYHSLDSEAASADTSQASGRTSSSSH